MPPALSQQPVIQSPPSPDLSLLASLSGLRSTDQPSRSRRRCRRASSCAAVGTLAVASRHPRHNVENAQGGDILAYAGLSPDVQELVMPIVVVGPKIAVQGLPEAVGCANSFGDDRVVDRHQSRPLPRDQLAGCDRADAVHGVKQIPQLPSRPRRVDQLRSNIHKIQGGWDLAQEVTDPSAVPSEDSNGGVRWDGDREHAYGH